MVYDGEVVCMVKQGACTRFSRARGEASASQARADRRARAASPGLVNLKTINKGINRNMGLEKEKADTCVFMDEEVFHSTIEPILKKKQEKARAPLPDRDPRNANARLKVRQSERCTRELNNPACTCY